MKFDLSITWGVYRQEVSKNQRFSEWNSTAATVIGGQKFMDMNYDGRIDANEIRTSYIIWGDYELIDHDFLLRDL